MKKHYLFIITLLTIISITFLTFSCDTTEPPDDIKPGRRDYTWQVDTLNFQNNTYDRMWGSSPNDIWLTSSGDWDKSIAQYNGEKWNIYGIPNMNVAHCIFGFTQNEIYIGAIGEIWKFNGFNWDKIAELIQNENKDIFLNDIWGESPNNFYVFGAYPDETGYTNNSVIVQILNNTTININTKNIKGTVGKLFENAEDGKIYCLVYEPGGGIYYDSTHIYKYENTEFKKIYGSLWNQGEEANLSLINGSIYFVLGNKIATYSNDKFQTVLQIDNLNFYQRIWGRSSKDIFLFMTDGLTHYNGENLEYLLFFEKPRTQIFSAMLFEKDVFFLVYESTTNLNLIYHGKIN